MPRGSWKWLLVQIGADAALINLAIWIAWYIRYELELAPGTTGEGFFYHPYSAYVPLAIALTFVTLGIFRFEGLYKPMRGRSFLDELYTLLNGTTTAILLIMAITFFWRPLVFSRAMYVYAALLIVVLLAIERIVRRVARARLRQRGIGVDRVLIVGAGEAGRALMRNIVAQPELAYQVVGFVDDDPEKNQTDIGRFQALGGTEQLPRLLKELAVNEVIVTLPWIARDKITRIMNLCQRYNLTAKLVPDLFQLSLSRVTIDDVGGIPLIAIREPQLGMVDAVIKRLMDLFFGSLLFLIAAPIMLVIAILIRLDSPGTIIFTQKRIGQYGHEFVTHKFRSMRQGAEKEQAALNGLNEATGPLFKIRDDPRRTRVGRWIRRMSLDELPQLLNVLRGEMSIVGPRPPTPEEVEQYQEWHKRRLDVRPGITGLSQVSGRSDLTFDETAMLDIYYIENWSPWMDLNIMLKTVPTVLLARGAY
ncbi:MAG: undecaprenyl-phosphate glucose phosphotransferase [Chloroflexi bacterium]|nr:undecaprenyl-phosphate glucose phosphotransferase [Chloroflexota bacterium]